MTPHQLANANCANADGRGCAGLGIADDLSTKRLWPRKERCTVDKERCLYFEQCVAPHVRVLEAGRERDAWLGALKDYVRRLEPKGRQSAKVTIFGKHADERIEELPLSRKCPSCGQPLEARKKLCDRCQKSARREANRQANQKHGSEYNSLAKNGS